MNSAVMFDDSGGQGKRFFVLNIYIFTDQSDMQWVVILQQIYIRRTERKAFISLGSVKHTTRRSGKHNIEISAIFQLLCLKVRVSIIPYARYSASHLSVIAACSWQSVPAAPQFSEKLGFFRCSMLYGSRASHQSGILGKWVPLHTMTQNKVISCRGMTYPLPLLPFHKQARGSIDILRQQDTDMN